jgi:hypothetical protein
VGRSSLHALLKPPSFIYAASRAEESEKLAKFASSSETWVSAGDPEWLFRDYDIAVIEMKTPWEIEGKTREEWETQFDLEQ